MLRNNKGFGEFAVLGVVALLALSLVVGLFWAWPNYRVWQKEQSGRAILAEARFSRQVRIEEAKAQLESAELLSEAEVKRAQGLRRATEEVREAFGGPDNYLRYLYIQALEQRDGEPQAKIIYVPTEAGIPILEAGKR